jgi:hypothetical protein
MKLSPENRGFLGRIGMLKFKLWLFQQTPGLVLLACAGGLYQVGAIWLETAHMYNLDLPIPFM